MKSILVTGGCGFIGSNFVRLLLQGQSGYRVINFDKLTYSGNFQNVADLNSKHHRFVEGDICDQAKLERVLGEERPSAVVNFAAESHVDRSILDAKPFLQTNMIGVQSLLESIRKIPVERFIHVSTDEVYGDRDGKEPASEESSVCPSSPYAASKAAADLLCFSYYRTYGLPVIVTRSSNNYGPYQFPEKLIPLIIHNALNEMELPIYGDGRQKRDWLYVEDNCRAILSVIEHGRVGSIYNIGTGEDHTNLHMVESLCVALAEAQKVNLAELKSRIRHVADRPGHDRRYAIDSSKIRSELGWEPNEILSVGLKHTVEWYLAHARWLAQVTSGEYRNYYHSIYSQRWGSAI